MVEGVHILVTGGAGFIGATLARELAAKNKVTLLDNMHRNALGVVFGDDADKLDLIKVDVTDANAVSEAIARVNPSHIVHAAGVAGIDSVGKYPVRTLEVNMLGTANVLRAIQDMKSIERVVTFSTSEIFGSQALRPSETSPAVVGAVGEPRWVYAVSKLAAEHLAFAYHRQYGVKSVTLRPFNVYGPGQVGEGAMSMFIQRAIVNDPIELYGDGSQIRSWCYVDDMVQGIMLALSKPEAVGQAFNIGNPRATATMWALARDVKRITGSQSNIINVARDGADIALRIPDIAHPGRLLGYAPKVDIEEGIERTAAAYRKRLQG